MAFGTRFSFFCLLLCICPCCHKKEIRPFQHVFLPPALSGEAPSIRNDFILEIDDERIHLTREYLEIHQKERNRELGEQETLESIIFDPKMVVVHYTVIPTLAKVVDYFKPNRIDSGRGIVTRNGALNVGVQFIVDRDGTIYGFYPENVIARHVIGLNHVAIGIENIGDADLETDTAGDKLPLTRAQLHANAALIRYLAGKYDSLRFLIGHMEYLDLEDPNHPAHDLFMEDNPQYRTEKNDPGLRFMAALRTALARTPTLSHTLPAKEGLASQVFIHAFKLTL